MKSILKKKNAFTIIELLVVVAIIAVLAVVVIISYSDAKSKSRDSRRSADLDGLNVALKMYYDDKKSLPVHTGSGICQPGSGGCLAELVDENYIATIPLDPVGGKNYGYYDYTSGTFIGNVKVAMLQANMENPARFGPFPYGYWCSDIEGKGWNPPASRVPTDAERRYCVGFFIS